MRDAIQMPADTQHLEAFRSQVSSLPNSDGWNGRSPNAFARWVGREPAALLEVAQDRAGLVAFLANRQLQIDLAAISILAWGKMRADHARMLFGKADREWLEVAGLIRDGQLTRQQSFDRFRRLKLAGRAPGMGPAHFTKLIHFLQPNTKGPTGHILDQWAGMSVNLIWGEPVTRLDLHRKWKQKTGVWSRGWSAEVSDATTAESYENFCCRVDWLAGNLNCDPQKIDRGFMSKNGAACWRSHLLNNYRDDL